jgi:selenide,water dikinase
MTKDLNEPPVKLTEYSHAAGCGCKIAPQLLEEILKSEFAAPRDKLIVGNSTKDDAAVYDLGNGTGLISTTDFFMPVVDDAFDFGRIASANAISDVYAMGGRPILALAILGWPVSKLPVELARKVIEGARSICAEAGITLAGGHSIDSPEPMFGLAVNGLIELKNLKRNSTAQEGDYLYLTKKIGVGVLSTATKRGFITKEHQAAAVLQMSALNKLGALLGTMPEVTAMTDVTGFGLLGHLLEMAEGSGLTAELYYSKVPFIEGLDEYIAHKCIPGNTMKSWNSYEKRTAGVTEDTRLRLCDPQTNGGLLFSVKAEFKDKMEAFLKEHQLAAFACPIGRMKAKDAAVVRVLS